MSEYENWFSVRFPNIQATIDQSNDQESKLLKLACKEVWQHQQAEIDNLKAQLNNMEACYIEKKKQVEDQQKRIDDVEAECKDWHRSSGSGLAVRILEVLRGEHE